MAEGLLRHLAGERFEVFSAGIKPTTVNPLAIKAMDEIGIDIAGQRSKSVSEFIDQEFNYVITVCDNARQTCTIFPGKYQKISWDLEDPVLACGSYEDKIAIFRKIREIIKENILNLFGKIKEDKKMKLLKEQINEFKTNFVKQVDEKTLKVMKEFNEKVAVKESAQGLKAGDNAPLFSLKNHLGETVELQSLLKKGKVVISFYRGEWCPYCNLEIKALQDHLSDFQALGANLVAITPESPDHSLSIVEKHQLKFPILTDVGNTIAKDYKLVFELSEELNTIYERFGIYVEKRNADHRRTLPVPATFIIGRNGIIDYAFVDADYSNRAEPDEIIANLKNSK